MERIRLKGNKLKNIFLTNKEGFSLIEMMVVVVILGLIVLGLVTFFTGGVKSWVAGQSQLTAQRNARQAMDRMVREIREGKNVISGSDSDTIVVSIPALGSEPTYDVTYNLSGTTIVRIKSATNLLIDNVLKITGEDIFEYYDSSGIKYDSPDSTTDKDGNSDVTFNTDVNLRNYGLLQ